MGAGSVGWGTGRVWVELGCVVYILLCVLGFKSTYGALTGKDYLHDDGRYLKSEYFSRSVPHDVNEKRIGSAKSPRSVCYCSSSLTCWLGYGPVGDLDNSLENSWKVLGDLARVSKNSGNFPDDDLCKYLTHLSYRSNGVCCGVPASDTEGSIKIFTTEEMHGLYKKTNKRTSQEPATNPASSPNVPTIYRGSARGPVMDRGHIFGRPDVPHEPPSRPEQPFSGRDEEEEEKPFQNFFHQTHPPMITHPPSHTNKPWWTQGSGGSGTTTTSRPWWVTTRRTQRPLTTTRPNAWWTTTKRPTRRPTTTTRRFTTIRPPTTTSRPFWTSLATQSPQAKMDWCSPSPLLRLAQSKMDSYMNTSERITGGSPLTPHSFPWLALIFQGPKHVCGGSLIDETHVLTAAHCVAGMTQRQVSLTRIILGTHNINARESGVQEFTIKTVVRHKDYSRTLLMNDIAAITLDRPVQISRTVHPLCLYDGRDELVDEVSTVAGWGSLFEGGPQLNTPRKVSLKIWNNAECRDTYGRAAPGGVVPTYLCAGRRGKDACSGDSGGPLVINKRGIWMQVGIVSWGIGCGKGHYPGIYSRISEFMPWIRKVQTKY